MDLSRTILVDYAFQHINPSFLSFAREYSQFILTSRIFGVKSWTFNNIRAKVPTNVQKRYHGLKMIIADNKTNVLQLSWRYLKANFIKCISEIGLYLFQNLISFTEEIRTLDMAHVWGWVGKYNILKKFFIGGFTLKIKISCLWLKTFWSWNKMVVFI